MQNSTVGDLINSLNAKLPIPIKLTEEQAARLIANPPEMIMDQDNHVFKIKLADGNYLNLHVKLQ